MINYNNNNKDENTTSTYTLRPGLLSFLNTLKPIYELISFTNESKEISDKYLQEIEMNKKYFDFNLYKEHNILIGRNLVKDISKIGRDMKRIIIVDKLYENIKATPQNGILIIIDDINGLSKSREFADWYTKEHEHILWKKK